MHDVKVLQKDDFIANLFFQQNDTNFNSIDFLQSSSFLAKMTPNQRVFIVEDFEIRSFCGKKIQRKMTWKQNLNTPLFVGGVQKFFFIPILRLLRPCSTAQAPLLY